jgi:hypothetical protein
MVDRRQFWFPERGRQRQVALDREFGGFGIEGLTIMEFDAGPELDRHLLAVGGCLM